MTHVSVLAVSAGLAMVLAGSGVRAQEINKVQEVPRVQEKKEIIIKEKGGAREKMTIVIDGDRVTVNGKPLAEYDDEKVIIRKRSEAGEPFVFVHPPAAPGIAFGQTAPRARAWRYMDEMESPARVRTPRAFLGVGTEKHEKGAEIQEVSEASPAFKAGLKEGDIITAVAGKPVTGPESLATLVRSHKPNEAVEITYLRDKKKKSVKVTLAKQPFESFSFSFPEFEGMTTMPELKQLELEIMPELERGMREQERAHRELQREYRDMEREFRFDRAPFMGMESRPRLGIRIEDMENGTGVKIVQVEPGSPAEKAGLKKDDQLAYIDGKKISSTDEALRSLREQREKASLPVTVTREGKPFNTEIKFPRERKEADLEP